MTRGEEENRSSRANNRPTSRASHIDRLLETFKLKIFLSYFFFEKNGNLKIQKLNGEKEEKRRR